MVNVLFLALNVASVAVSDVAVVTVFAVFLVHSSVSTEASFWCVDQRRGWRARKSTDHCLHGVRVRFAGFRESAKSLISSSINKWRASSNNGLIFCFRFFKSVKFRMPSPPMWNNVLVVFFFCLQARRKLLIQTPEYASPSLPQTMFRSMKKENNEKRKPTVFFSVCLSFTDPNPTLFERGVGV